MVCNKCKSEFGNSYKCLIDIVRNYDCNNDKGKESEKQKILAILETPAYVEQIQNIEFRLKRLEQIFKYASIEQSKNKLG